MDSERNPIINEVNWNILVTLGKEIKRDSMISVNESRTAYIKHQIIYKYIVIKERLKQIILKVKKKKKLIIFIVLPLLGL